MNDSEAEGMAWARVSLQPHHLHGVAHLDKGSVIPTLWSGAAKLSSPLAGQ